MPRSAGPSAIPQALGRTGSDSRGELQEQAGWSVATEFGVSLLTMNAGDDYGAPWTLIGSRAMGRTMFYANAVLAQNRDRNTELSGLIVEDLATAPVRPVGELTLNCERE